MLIDEQKTLVDDLQTLISGILTLVEDTFTRADGMKTLMQRIPNCMCDLRKRFPDLSDRTDDLENPVNPIPSRAGRSEIRAHIVASAILAAGDRSIPAPSPARFMGDSALFLIMLEPEGMLEQATPIEICEIREEFLSGMIGSGPYFFAIHCLSVIVLAYTLRSAYLRPHRRCDLIAALPLLFASIAVYIHLFGGYEAFERQDYRAILWAIAPSRALLLIAAVSTSLSLILPRVIQRMRYGGKT